MTNIYTPCLWDLLPPEHQEEEEMVEEPRQVKEEIKNDVTHFYHKAYSGLIGRRPPCEITVSYFPYSTVQAKIWRKNGTLQVRMSKVLHDMPEDIHKALALILVGKYESKPYPKVEARRFDAYVSSELITARMAQQQKTKPKSTKHYGVDGFRFNLLKIFETVNRKYFNGELKQPPISWTKTPSRRRLGFVNSSGHVYISKILDRISTPKYFIEFIMYHELLHLVCPSKLQGKRVIHHTKEFRQAEKVFQYYDKARRRMGYR